MPPTLLVATTNPGKLEEIQALLDGAPVRLVTLARFPDLPEPEETGTTFAENALIKARAYASRTGLPTVAEDSGLEIDALGGAPGIQSARYPGRTYADKFAGLYARLQDMPRPWTARFVCELACVDSGGAPLFTSRGTVEGEIAGAPRGDRGFGYDPIFLYPPYGKTLGEVAGTEKLAVVHRGKAFRAFRRWLEDNGALRLS
ncbi:MAG: RdgB/HAM1 family non-canonical purine NTP pyrophosphatase [Vicinamibacterales bacterium]